MDFKVNTPFAESLDDIPLSPLHFGDNSNPQRFLIFVEFEDVKIECLQSLLQEQTFDALPICIDGKLESDLAEVEARYNFLYLESGSICNKIRLLDDELFDSCSLFDDIARCC